MGDCMIPRTLFATKPAPRDVPAVLILSGPDVNRVIDTVNVMVAVEACFRESSAGEAQVPARIKLSLFQSDDRLIVMPAYLPSAKALATKILTVFPGNAARRRPLIAGVVVLNDPETGIPLAVIDGASITTVRTAAGSAVAARALARPKAETLAVIGAGAQGRAHLQVFAQLYGLREVRVCARRPESAERLAREAARWTGAIVRAVATPEEATRGADLVVTATTAARPVLQGTWLGAGVHVSAVGAATLTHQEIDSDVLTRASVIAVDTREGALAEAGDLVVPIREGCVSPDRVVEVGEVLLGLRTGRQSADEITLYKAVGTAAMDAAVAVTVYRRAIEQGVGTHVALGDGG